MRTFYNLAIATVVVLSFFVPATAHAEPIERTFEYYRAPGTRADSWYPGYVDGYWVNYPYRPGFSNYRGSQFRYGGPYRYGYTSPYFGGDAGLRAKRDLDAEDARAEDARNAKPADPKK